MKIKKFILTTVLATAFLCVGQNVFAAKENSAADCLSTVGGSNYSTQERINCLQNLISQIMQQIKDLQNQQGFVGEWCHTFNKNLGVGDSGSDFEALLTVLDKEGIMEFISSNRPLQYDERVAGGVSALQQKYADKILAPYGLKYPTGYFGKSTRAWTNGRYGCVTQTPECTTDSDCTYRCTGSEKCVNMTGKCVNGKCVFNYSDKIQEQVKCVFNNNNSNAKQECYGAGGDGKFSCFGTNTCVTDVSGKRGEQITWKSSCGGYAYTTIDGNNEYANFDCNSTQPSITVTSPSGSVSVGSSVQISWVVTGNIDPANVGIGFCPKGETTTGIHCTESRIYPNIGTASVRLDGALNLYAGQWYPVVSSGTVCGTGNTFTVVGSTTPSITVTSPNGGETWTAGSTHNITWTSTNLDSNANVNIAFISGGASVPIVTVSNSGVYSWTLPFGNGATGLKISITSALNSSVNDTSDGTFTIAGNNSPSITVTSPNGGENWKVGETHNITWSTSGSANNGTVYLYLKDSGDPFSGVFASNAIPASAGVYSWTIPSAIPAGNGISSPIPIGGSGKQYKIMVADYVTGEVHSFTDESDNYFTISAAQANPPVINSFSPSSGPVGALVTINGSGFTPTGNVITFGDYQMSGTAPSSDGTTLQFYVPRYSVTPQNQNLTQTTIPGMQYQVIVNNANGYSNHDKYFSVTSSSTSYNSYQDQLASIAAAIAKILAQLNK